MKNLERFGPHLLILISLGVGGFFAYVATTRISTGLESFLWQAFTLVASVVGAFLFGRQSASEAAREIIKPHARSAFRRLLSLYQSLSQVASVIESSKNCVSREDYRIILATLKASVGEQLATADDALEDWRDIVPEDVEELRQRLSPDNATRDKR